MRRKEIMHICVKIIDAEKTLNVAVDKLLAAIDITREEVTNGNIHQKTDTS